MQWMRSRGTCADASVGTTFDTNRTRALRALSVGGASCRARLWRYRWQARVGSASAAMKQVNGTPRIAGQSSARISTRSEDRLMGERLMGKRLMGERLMGERPMGPMGEQLMPDAVHLVSRTDPRAGHSEAPSWSPRSTISSPAKRTEGRQNRSMAAGHWLTPRRSG
jgi:hypothetical protein